jgi:hypothetical protein
MAALGALPAGVVRVNSDQANTSKRSFVFQEGPKLCEGPTMQDAPLFPASPYPATNPNEILTGDTATGAFGQRNDLLADYVVDITGETSFLARESFQVPLSGSGLCASKCSTKAAMSSAYSIEHSPRTDVAIRVRGDIDYSKIATQEVLNILRIGGIGVASGGQVEHAVVQEQVRFSLAVPEKRQLPEATHKWYFQAPTGGPNVDETLIHIPPQTVVIVGDGSQRSEASFRPTVELVGIGHLGDAPNHNLCREAEFQFGCTIAKPMEVEGAEGFGLPTLTRDPVTTGIGSAQGLSQGTNLRWSSKQFDLGRQFHSRSIAHIHPKWRGSMIPPLAKVDGLLVQDL